MQPSLPHQQHLLGHRAHGYGCDTHDGKHDDVKNSLRQGMMMGEETVVAPTWRSRGTPASCSAKKTTATQDSRTSCFMGAMYTWWSNS